MMERVSHRWSADGGDATHKWRRGRDSNPRYAFDVYSLSRGAPSTTRPPLRCGLIICIRVGLQGLFAGFHILRRLRPSRAVPEENRSGRCEDDSVRIAAESRFRSSIRRVGVPSWHSLTSSSVRCSSYSLVKNRGIAAVTAGDCSLATLVKCRIRKDFLNKG